MRSQNNTSDVDDQDRWRFKRCSRVQSGCLYLLPSSWKHPVCCAFVSTFSATGREQSCILRATGWRRQRYRVLERQPGAETALPHPHLEYLPWTVVWEKQPVCLLLHYISGLHSVVWPTLTEQDTSVRELVYAQPCPTLYDPMDCSPPGSSVHGVSQARILEWVAIPFSRGSSQFKDRTPISCLESKIMPRRYKKKMGHHSIKWSSCRHLQPGLSWLREN